MKVKELREKLEAFPDDLEVLTKKTDFGNVGLVFTVREDTYASWGKDIPCVIISDEGDDEEE